MKDEHDDTLQRIAHHFVQKGLLILGVWMVKRYLWQREKLEDPGTSVVTGKARRHPPFKLYRNPQKDFKAVNPAWLKKLAEQAQQGKALGPPAACPVVDQFERERKGKGAPAGGEEARRTLFLLEDDVVYLNHGSYGATLRLAANAQSWYRDRLEAQPVRFMEDEAIPALMAALQGVADLVGCDFRDLVAVTNATTAINTVVQSLHLCKGDLLLMTNLTYPAVKHTLARAAAAAGAGLLEVDFTVPMLRQGNDAVIGAFKEALRGRRGRIKLAVIDHIASNPPFHFPVTELCALCKTSGAKVLVDGAHAVGALPLQIAKLGADYYTSNLHKWLCSPKGTAFLWVDRSQQRGLAPLVTSHGYGMGFWAEMLWTGTRDATGMMAVPASLAVLESIGLERVRDYNHSLLLQAVALLTSAWGCHAVIGAEAPHACMAAVQLPPLGEAFPITVPSALHLHGRLRAEHNIEVPCSCYGGALWVRISAQYYNSIRDYQLLAQAVLSFARGGQANGWSK